MKRIIPVLIVALAVAAFYFRDRWLPPPPGAANYLGYVEGETVLIAASQAGRIVARPATKGAEISQGDIVFSLDPVAAEAEVSRTEAATKTAEAELANLLTGKREAELESIRAQRREAEAGLELAKKELTRASTLASTGTAAQSRLDQAEATVAQYQARIAQFEAAEAAGGLPGREAELAAARSRIKESEAASVAARQKLADLSPRAPVNAKVEDKFFDVGEWVSAGQPVVSLLPPDAVTLRFFVPERALAKASPGTTITFICDGCGEAMTATITRVETTPEYTPPVIYSQQARSKLVYLTEARPTSQSSFLRPGLPIEVEPLQ
jgi:HlyD family secretion protein